MSQLKDAALLILLMLFLAASAAATAQESTSSSLTDSTGPTQLASLSSTSSNFASLSKAYESVSRDGAEGVIQVPPAPRVKKELPSQRPFRTAAFGIKLNTMGVGAELATPLARSFNLRSGFNFATLAYPFDFDGVSYNVNFHVRSSQTTLDWFPGVHSFHISPGLLYLRNTSSAALTVAPGQEFTFGDEAFINSIGDPVNGKMSVVFPHSLCPLLLVGFGNVLPRSSRRISVPFELGAAYTGAAVASANLTGTACTSEGCLSFADDADAQSRINLEVQKANELFKRIPIYPILSFGVAYHF